MCSFCGRPGFTHPVGDGFADGAPDTSPGFVSADAGASTSAASAAKPVGTIPQLADYLINGFWQYQGTIAHHWGSATISYNISALNTAERALAQSALNAWQEVTNLTFVQTTGTANITYTHSGSMTAYETDRFTASGIVTSATINISQDWITTDGGANDGKTGIDSYGYQTYLHETGHALGLGHQGPYNGSASYSANASYANDTWQYSLMSYFPQNSYDGSSYRYVITPQMADIYAVQQIYGVATATRAGDTTYGFNNTAGSIYNFSSYSPAPALTIYDSVGFDTLDCSGYSAAQTIDLHAGAFSSVGGLVRNIGIAVNSTIECAVGGSGNDTLIANDFGNALIGGGGSDRLVGGAGIDTAVFSGLRAQYAISSRIDGTVLVTDLRSGALDGSDTLSSIEKFRFSDGAFDAPSPDLVVSSITLAGSSVIAGGLLNYTYIVANQGSGSAFSTSWAAAYVDQQVVPVTNSWNYTNLMLGGASQTFGNSISTSGLSIGQHTLWIKADNFNSANGQFNSGLNNIAESDETNNWTSVAFAVVAPSPPDLIISSITPVASSVTQGRAFDYSYVVANQGAGVASSTSWAAAYLDQQVVPITNSWNLTHSLSAGNSETLSNTINTSDLSVGQHTLWIKADNFNSANGQFNSGVNDITESNEANNWTSVTFTITAPASPDLVVSSITPAATSLAQGSAFSYSYVIANQGAGAALATSWAAAYLDQQVVPVANSWNFTHALAAGVSETFSQSIGTSGLSVGQHTLWLKADNFNSANGQFNSGVNNVAESNESNNWTSINFTVINPAALAAPDLVISSITPASSIVSQGDRFDFSYMVANQGVGAAMTGSWAAAYLDQQVTPFTNSWNWTQALQSGASETLVNSISTSGLSIGQHTLWIKADNFNSANGQFNSGVNNVAESNEANNWTAINFNVTAPTHQDLFNSPMTADHHFLLLV